jgi:hypothetical protein
MRWLVPLVVLVGCHRGGQENLGLSSTGTAVDVARLTRPSELVRALALSGRDLDDRLGPHRMDATSTLKLELPSHETQELGDTFIVEADGRGGVHVLHDNGRDNGFEAVAVGRALYVKPRYGRYVKSAIEGDELTRLRAAAETTAASDLRLLQRFVQVQEAGAAEVAGHAGIKLHLSARSSPPSAPDEDEPGRKWRRTVSVRSLDGDVVLDRRTGAPLAVRLEAAYGFERDGKPMTATLRYQQTTAPAAATAIAAPPDFATLGRIRPIVDRQQLLEGLK